MKLVLIGMMGSGKSTIGRRVAKELNWAFYDVDSEIERVQNLKIPEIFALKGEGKFRSLEKEMIQKLSQKDKVVLSTGGGAPCSAENWKALSQEAVILWLKASPKQLLERVQKKPLEVRPLLKQGISPLEVITQLLNSREKIYKKADYILETDGWTIPEVCQKILDLLRTKT